MVVGGGGRGGAIDKVGRRQGGLPIFPEQVKVVSGVSHQGCTLHRAPSRHKGDHGVEGDDIGDGLRLQGISETAHVVAGVLLPHHQRLPCIGDAYQWF